MAKKKKQVSQAPVPLTRGQVSRRERERQRIRNLYTAAMALGTLVVLLIGFAVVNTFVLRPNAQVAKVGDVSINRAEYTKFRRYNLFQQLQNAAIMQQFGQEGATLQPGASNLTDLQRALREVENETSYDTDTVNQLIDNEVLRQASAQEFGLNPSKEELLTFAFNDFLPTPTPPVTATPLPVTPSASITGVTTITGTATFTGTATAAASATATRTPTAGSPTVTPTASATLPPVAGAEQTAQSLFTRYSSALGNGVEPAPSSSYCAYGCPGISEDDFLKIAFEPRYRREQVTDRLTASVNLTESTQIRVQHILTDTQEGAQSIITRLDGGVDFTMLANEQSKEQIENVAAGRPANGGVIEWFPEEGSNLVQEFVDCAFATEVGAYGQPCSTSFGWHVIKVLEKDDSRPREQSQRDALETKYYEDWFAAVKNAYLSGNRITSVLPPAAILPTQPPIADPTTPPVQQPTAALTPGATPPITTTGTLTATSPDASDTLPITTTPALNSTPTVPNQ